MILIALLSFHSVNAHSHLDKSSMEQKGEKAPKGIPDIPLGGFTSAFSVKSTSWLTPDGQMTREI
jgi:hypothetical protein